MRITTIAVAVAFATPMLLGAQSMSATTRARAAAPETTFVKGTVTGEIPTGSYTITGSRSVFITIPAVGLTSSTSTSAMPAESRPTVEEKVEHGVGEAAGDASKLGKKVVHGAREAGGDVSKLGKKAAHGVKEAASDVKKKVTGKP